MHIGDMDVDLFQKEQVQRDLRSSGILRGVVW
jgi:hypothetical protein